MSRMDELLAQAGVQNLTTTVNPEGSAPNIGQTIEVQIQSIQAATGIPQDVLDRALEAERNEVTPIKTLSNDELFKQMKQDSFEKYGKMFLRSQAPDFACYAPDGTRLAFKNYNFETENREHGEWLLREFPNDLHQVPNPVEV